MKKIICEQCKKEIYGGYITMKSAEPEDFGREFYLHKSCAEENYLKNVRPVN